MLIFFPLCLVSFGTPASAQLPCFESDSVTDRHLHSFLIVCALIWLGISCNRLLFCPILNGFIEVDEDSIFCWFPMITSFFKPKKRDSSRTEESSKKIRKEETSYDVLNSHTEPSSDESSVLFETKKPKFPTETLVKKVRRVREFQWNDPRRLRWLLKSDFSFWCVSHLFHDFCLFAETEKRKRK